LEHNDANRTLMGAGMQKQALDIEGKESPIVETGVEKLIAKNNTLVQTSNESGLIKFINTKKIITSISKENKKINIRNNALLNKIKKNIKYKKTRKIKNIKIELLQKNQESNSIIYSKNFNFKNKNNWIKKGEIFTDKKKRNKGKLSLGKNLLIGYLSWKGYNFEDSIIVNEKLLNENSFTSSLLKKQTTFLINNKVGEVRK
jgi:DNA-directed RNA polymerase subunit beta